MLYKASRPQNTSHEGEIHSMILLCLFVESRLLLNPPRPSPLRLLLRYYCALWTGIATGDAGYYCALRTGIATRDAGYYCALWTGIATGDVGYYCALWTRITAGD